MAAEFKLSYTAQEIDERLGKIDDLAEKSELPTKLSQLTNDTGFITATDYQETDPTVPAWAKRPSKPEYTATEVGALPNTTVIPSSLVDLADDADVPIEHQNRRYLLEHFAITEGNCALEKAKNNVALYEKLKQYGA
jgi:hypothetical protein